MTTDKESPTEQRTDKQPIRYVLFVCNHNAGRSQSSHILTLAYRQTRQCLRQDTCELLSPVAS